MRELLSTIHETAITYMQVCIRKIIHSFLDPYAFQEYRIDLQRVNGGV